MKSDEKKMFITGGAGFIGSRLTNHLLGEGFKVLVFDNLSVGRRSFLNNNKNLKFIKGDILNKKLLSGSVKDFSPNFLIHLAAIHFIPLCNKYPIKTVENNIIGTKNVLEAAKRSGINLKKVLIASSGAVYYGCKEKEHKEEKDLMPTEMYSYSKYVNELQLRHFYNITGINSAAMRFFNVYGPNETNPHLFPAIFSQLKSGRSTLVIGNPKPKRPYIFVDDIVNAITMIIKLPKKGFEAYNIGSDKEYSAAEVINIISGLVGKKLKFKSDPSLIRKEDVIHFKPSLTKIKKEIGWWPKYDIKKGLSKLLEEEKVQL
ncbi:MAG: nucleoside-diphosphate sugar epimerase [Candidatus Yanofskybacteria bacterium CG10_big_fil_rev_8_21_14_0_10_37_15]|uniref:Nucleoside-diphosphate sugar epimerase n=1 Tax=Candidatus Yanofskybacteria bacterium CG10_big_fil_rev_8_21_14_0_10_37_15 TaxID=1975097 RepID=A0A2H0R5R4_9BACT|nr:MAG: nucleoside-diphosphate sugar epimerase [Candidatus Yanofskybacteria bacterium CG10_big_fil_rev_8_21_14_0_10_37_15]